MTDVPSQLRFVHGDQWDPAAGQRRRDRSWPQLCEDLATLGEALERDLAEVGPEQALTPALCAGWDVRDIVLHLVVGDDLALRSLRGEDCFPRPTQDAAILEEESRARVAAVAHLGFDEAVAEFLRGRRRLLAFLAHLSPDDHRAAVGWVARPISRLALVQSRVMETWIHGWDLRQPLGLDTEFDDRAWWVADLGVRHLPYALGRSKVPLDDLEVDVSLDGSAGGTWRRLVARDGSGAGRPRPVTVSGPAWAWVAVVSRRAPARTEALAALAATPQRPGASVLDQARAFA